MNPVIEARVLAFAIANPGLGPRRISATGPGALGRPRYQPHRGLAHPASARPLAAGGPPLASWPAMPRHRSRTATRTRAPHRGRPSGRARGLRLLPRGPAVRHEGQGLAVHRHRSGQRYVWAELHTTPLNPMARNTSRLARRVAADLASCGWRLERALTDNGSEFRSVRASGTRCGRSGRCRRDPPGPAHLQRLGRAGPAHDPRGVLATIVRAEPRAQDGWARAGPRALSVPTTTPREPIPDATRRGGRPGRRSSERGR